jgi:hypothetical protein
MLTRSIDTAVLIIFTAPVLVLTRLLVWRDAARVGNRQPAGALVSARTRV